MLGNVMFMTGFVGFFMMFGALFFRKETKEETAETDENHLESLIKETLVMLNDISKNAPVKGKTSDTEVHTAVEQAIRTCSDGQKGARDVVKSVIYEWLINEKKPDYDFLNEIFESPENTRIRFEAILFLAEKDSEGTGFKKLWDSRFKDIALCVGELNGSYIDDAYSGVCKSISYNDRLMILTNVLYADSVGLGTIDSVMWQKKCVEEIQIGMSGAVKENYDYKNACLLDTEKNNKKYSYESVHVMISGNPIKMDFLGMKNEDELIRITRNLIKNAGAGELTRKNPRIVCETPDGRRITVTRPPFSDSWAALIRKFDTVSVTTVDMLTDDVKLKSLIRELISTRKSIAITGETASGKTTWLRALLLESGKDKSIRVIESESFELNLREYLPHANVLTLRVSDNDKASGVLGFSKKTTGQVFAVGEVNTPDMAVTLVDISHTAERIFFTAHYTDTRDMVSDFTGALLNFGGYSDERLAKEEATAALGVDIHLRRKDGRRYVERISEVMSDGSIRCLYGIQKKN